MKLILKLCIFFLNILYSIFKLLPTKNKVVFMSRQSNYRSIDIKLLVNRLKKQYNVVVLCKTLDGKENSNIFVRIGYAFHMIRQMYHLATSKVCVIDSYIPTVSVLKHKKDLTVIQMWHSNGTMKKFGYSALDKREGTQKKYAQILKMHKGYDIILSSSSLYNNHLVKGFGLENDKSILTYTLPRYDLLKSEVYENKIKDIIYKKYPQLKEKKNVVYAPTFRDDEDKFCEKLNDLIDVFNYEKYNLIVKLHPLSKLKIKNENVIVDYNFSTFDMLFIADKLISDYSCIIYEAGVRNIPLYFYAYDLFYYDFIRGIALDYDELPGYTERDAKDLVKDLDKRYDMKALKKFINDYVQNTDNCTQKIVDLISEYMVNN